MFLFRRKFVKRLIEAEYSYFFAVLKRFLHINTNGIKLHLVFKDNKEFLELIKKQRQAKSYFEMTTGFCRIDLRHDQRETDIEASRNSAISIVAPSWIQNGLKSLTEKLNGVGFEVHSYDNSKSKIIQRFTIDNASCPLDLKLLQMIARCEERNVTGFISKLHYSPAGLSDEVIYAIRDLVRQTIVIGLDETNHYGGYPNGERKSQVKPVYIIDLSGLQFQQSYNTGRLVLVKDKLPIGLLDDFIFENVVGEPKKPFKEVEIEYQHQSNKKGRYIKYPCQCIRSGHLVDAYFDTKAYRRFVAMDVILCGIALNQQAMKNGHKVNFKFLKYGTGYFAGNLKLFLEDNLLPRVIDGLEILFAKQYPASIKHIEFPFYRPDDESKKRLDALQKTYGVGYRFSHDDALKKTVSGLITATTNCADPHAPCGNEMGFHSVDAAISENIKSRGNSFSAALNKDISSYYIQIPSTYFDPFN